MAWHHSIIEIFRCLLILVLGIQAAFQGTDGTSVLLRGLSCCHPQVGVIRLQLMHQCIYTNSHGKFEEKHLLPFTTHFKTSAFCQNKKKRSHVFSDIFFWALHLGSQVVFTWHLSGAKTTIFSCFFSETLGPLGFHPLRVQVQNSHIPRRLSELVVHQILSIWNDQRTQQHGVLVMGWDGRRWTIFWMGSWIGWIFFV